MDSYTIITCVTIVCVAMVMCTAWVVVGIAYIKERDSELLAGAAFVTCLIFWFGGAFVEERLSKKDTEAEQAVEETKDEAVPVNQP